VSRYSDRDLESLLRRALAEEADRVHPAGDGLSRIRARTSTRRRWARWWVPALALAGAAAVIAAVAVLPSMLTKVGGSSVQPGARGSSSVPAPSTSPPPVPQTTIPKAGVADMVTVWPYPTRRDGFERAEKDIAAGRYPDLTRPDVAAVTFVQSFVGDQGLTATPAGRYLAGLRMEVKRGGTSVSLVYLVRVRVGNDAPYVVVNATRNDREPSLALLAPPRLSGTAAVTVRGELRRADGEPDPAVSVELREPGQNEALAQSSGTVTGRGPTRAWSAELTPLSAVGTATGVVAVWTADARGVLEFVAAPTAR